jgi:hypothetical protein
MSNRRRFIKNSSLLIGGLPFLEYVNSLPKLDLLAKPNIEIYNTNWGFEGSLEDFLKKSQAAGYDGIEVWVPSSEAKRTELVNLTAKYGLKLGLLAGNGGKTAQEHLKSFKNSISNAISCSPEFINCHSGRDFFTYEENAPFIQHTIKESKTSGIPIYHETHRGKILFAAQVAERFIDQFKDLHLTLDISHWTVVHESLLENQKERVAKALSRTSHIHSRVGFQEAPQIPHASDTKYKGAVDAHFAWWDEVVKMKTEKGEKLTMTTEFGPPPYMWTYPFKDEPLAKVWDENVAMMKMWKLRYLNQ